MRNDQEKAIKLRKLGKSYSEITTKLGIPKSTLSDWFRKLDWSKKLKNKLHEHYSLKSSTRRRALHAVLKGKWNDWYKKCRQEAIDEFPNLKDNPLFVAGLMLYWGGGDKQLKNSQVRLSNSDPEFIKIYYNFLVYILRVSKEKITANLILYPDLINEPQKRFWSKATGIQLQQFRASNTIRGKHPTRRFSYGVCIVRLSNRKIKEKIMKWIEMYSIHANGQFLSLEK